MTGLGHNTVGGVANERLRSFIERIERLNDEKAALGSDVRDVFAEARTDGFDVQVMRAVLRLRKMDADDRDEMETLLDLYRRALGMR